MGKRRKILALILSMLMAVQMPVMAGELMGEEEAPVVEEIPAEEVLIDEEIPEEVVIEEQLPEEVAEEELQAGELLEEATDYTFEEELVEEPIETITEELPAEEIGTVPSEEEGIIEEDEPALVGETSGQCGDNAYWSLNDEGVMTISGTGDMYDYEWDNPLPWEQHRHEIKGIVIESGVTSIGGGAFYDCSALTSMTIGDSVTNIGDWAFYGCSSLTSVTIPDSVTSIGDGAFDSCSSLTSVTIPDSVTSIGDGAFESCDSLGIIVFMGDAPQFVYDQSLYENSDAFGSIRATVYYPINNPTWTADVCQDYGGYITWKTWDPLSGVQPYIKDWCGDNVYWTLSDDGVLIISGTGDMYDYHFEFDQETPWANLKSRIENIIIEQGVTNIGVQAFLDCTSLKSVTIPDSVTTIDNYAFYGCSSLTNVTIPDSVERIYESAFSHCTSLVSVTIPDSVNYIDDNTFRECTSLTSVTIPDSVTSIGGWAFLGCTSLKSATISDSVTDIGEGVFQDCTSLTSITIPDSVRSIGNAAFDHCTSLTSVTIPDSVTYIDSYAFDYCTSLTSVTIPDSVTYIASYAFGECLSLETFLFKGDALEFGLSSFEHITATAYYPIDNPTWTKNVRQNYGGNITWIPLRSNGKTGFSDVTNPDDFFYDPIYWAVDNGITTGYKDNTFRPRNNCNRAAVATFLWRLAGKPDEGISTAFSDMTGNDDFDHAITWAANHGITNGYNDGTFRPWDTCHRAAIVTFLWRYAGRPEPTTMANFSDMTGNDDFDKAISWASEKGITTGYTDGTFRPYNQCLRLAVATFLYRYAHL